MIFGKTIPRISAVIAAKISRFTSPVCKNNIPINIEIIID
jgi:hypothetical protein